ncbi:hypothetical protein HPB49_002935 [Dermacentor silvarum]|uniref:Uncharacterized protein n=1 Tax=Dermacentor silvarum TaxID=543639 RepID=A0ACB8CPG8_DERSI|nr:hypothetical protein HPB49_002935 [Dermacentor silvarum]
MGELIINDYSSSQLLSRTKPAVVALDASSAGSADGDGPKVERPQKSAESRLPTLEEFLEKRDFTGAMALLEFTGTSSSSSQSSRLEAALWTAYCAFHLGQHRHAMRIYQELLADKSMPPPLNQQGGPNARSNPRVEASMQANGNQQRQQYQGSRTNAKPPPRRATPPLPDNDYKVVYRPRTGMKRSSWPDEKITEGLARASGSPFKEFCANVTIQTQWKQNLIIASSADEDYALKLGSINGIELGAATYEMTPYIKPLPETVRGVVHGITACTTEKRLAEHLAASNCGILHAGMLGTSTSAVITFEGPHVPFYVKVASSYTRCRPYRRSVQYCKACGEIGHRQDVCPNSDKHICNRCGVHNPQADHDYQLQCKLCGLPHETASKECEKRLKPRPPPLYVRERSKSRGRQPSITRETSSSSSEYGTNKPQQEQQKISWAEVIASSKSKTDPFPSLPTQERN